MPVSLALLLILACVPDGLVPEEKWGDAEKVEGRDDAFGILEGLEGVRTNVSSFLVQCSKEVRACWAQLHLGINTDSKGD